MAVGTRPAGDLALASTPGRWVLAATVLGSGMAFLDATVVNVALPTIGRDLGLAASGLQWILNGYLLPLAALVLLGGALGDRHGRRRVFVLGVALFTAASVVCAAAPDAGVLVAARMVQGAGAALLTPTSLALVQATYRPRDRARAIGAWSALTGVAAAVGPPLGGALVDVSSWRLVFLVNFPVGMLVVLASRHVPESGQQPEAPPLDVLGPILVILGLGCATYALVEAPALGADPTVVTCSLVGVAALVGFLAVEAHSPHPMLPLALFASRQFAVANAVTFLVYGALGGAFFLLVAFLQVALGYSAAGAGLAALPMTLLMLALSGRSGALVQRVGPRLPLSVGPLVVAAGLLLMAGIDPGDHYVRSVLPAVVVFGSGLALVVAPVTATVLAAVQPVHVGVASGANNAVARIAGLLSVAVLPPLAGLSGDGFYDPVAMTHGFGIAMTVCAALSATGGVLALVTMPRDSGLVGPRSPRPRQPDRLACAIAAPPMSLPADALLPESAAGNTSIAGATAVVGRQ